MGIKFKQNKEKGENVKTDNKKMTNKIQTNIKSEVRILDDKIDEVTKKIVEKTSMSESKAKSELQIGIVMGMMMNRHKVQEMNDK